MQVYIMLIYVWTGSSAVAQTQEFTSAGACEAARAALVAAVEEATRAEAFPHPGPVVLCVAK